MRRPSKNHSAVYKAKVALAAIKSEQTLAEFEWKVKAHPKQIAQLKIQPRRRVAHTLDGVSGPQDG